MERDKRFWGRAWGCGLGEVNVEGNSFIEFLSTFDLTLANTCFKKRDHHFITYKSGVTCSQISFFPIRKSGRKICLHRKVIPGESLTTQYGVLFMDVRVKKISKRRSDIGAPYIKCIWRVKNKRVSNTRSWRDDSNSHKEMQMICGEMT